MCFSADISIGTAEQRTSRKKEEWDCIVQGSPVLSFGTDTLEPIINLMPYFGAVDDAELEFERSHSPARQYACGLGKYKDLSELFVICLYHEADSFQVQ